MLFKLNINLHPIVPKAVLGYSNPIVTKFSEHVTNSKKCIDCEFG